MKRVTGFAVLVLSAAWLGCSPSSPSAEPTGYDLRVDAFFDATIESEPRNTYSEIMRVDRGVAPDESKIQFDLDRLVMREDTSDFKLPVLLWMLYEYSDSELLSAEILDNAEETILAHKFWPDERLNEPDPEKTDSMVYVTENHFILYATSGYLAGQLYPDEVFAASGETGAEKMETFSAPYHAVAGASLRIRLQRVAVERLL